jgi:hypothetical protein
MRSNTQAAGLLLSLTLAASAAAQGQVPPQMVETEKKLEAEVEIHPDSSEARVALAKVLHFEAVDGDAEAAKKSTDLLERLASERPQDPMVLAYLGSARLLAAKRAWAPWQRIALVRQGLGILDRAVAMAPEDPEVRFMRGASTRPLPRYFGRAKLSADDLVTAADHARQACASGKLDKQIAAAIFYLHGFTRLDLGDRAGTEASWRAAIEMSPESEAAQKATARLARGEPMASASGAQR